ncbi:sensor histidine kinase [Paenibacillus puerhi]|uniref:sensor histidine kinase n=1 Tax=Paenibacillus puerhi TaxID=2692622 RepID=UPI00135995CC|nr:histidine kinase [Paenibacillus puerhi]
MRLRRNEYFFFSRSIKARMLAIFIMIIAMMTVGFIISFYRQSVIATEYNHFIRNYSDLSRLPIFINKSSKNFEALLMEKSEEALHNYEQANLEIDTILLPIRNEIGESDNNLIYYRTLSNMLEQQKAMVKQILQNPNYSDITYLRNLYVQMNQQAQWLTISYLDYSSGQYVFMLEKARQMEKMVYLIIVCFSLLSIGAAVMLSKGLFDTILMLSKSAKLLSMDAQFHTPDLKIGKYMELNTVVEAFNKMKNNMRLYIIELQEKVRIESELNSERLINLEKDRLLKETQLLSLQMQMNPHFLFNTLNIISRKAMLQKTQTAIELIQSISAILRYNLDNQANPVPLSEEIQILNSYILIQQVRFGDRMSFQLHSTSKSLDALIPPMILQPVVENAIVHGMKNVLKDGKIYIFLNEDEDHIRIEITDNGAGMPEEQIARLFNGIHEKNGKSIGLHNVRQRLQLYFERDDLLSVSSTLGCGTNVMISIPKNARMVVC